MTGTKIHTHLRAMEEAIIEGDFAGALARLKDKNARRYLGDEMLEKMQGFAQRIATNLAMIRATIASAEVNMKKGNEGAAQQMIDVEETVDQIQRDLEMLNALVAK